MIALLLDGTVTAIDDQAALWAATVAGVAAMASRGAPASGAGAIARDSAAPLAEMPEARQRAILAGPLTTMLAGNDASLSAGTRPVSLPGGALAGGRPLAGTQEIEEQSGSRLRIVTHAGDGAMRIDRERIVDRASGLVASFDETVTVGGEVPILHQHTTFSPSVR